MRCDLAENRVSEPGTSLIGDLSKIAVFSDLPQEDLEWLAIEFQQYLYARIPIVPFHRHKVIIY